MIEKEETIIGNLLIAKFLEWEEGGYDSQTGDILTFYIPEDQMGYTGVVSTDDLKFERSWDLLFSCVEKIEAIRDEKYGWFQVYIYGNICDISSKYLHLDLQEKLPDGKDVYMSDPNAIFPTKIESVWYNCVNFIKFWNEVNK